MLSHDLVAFPYYPMGSHHSSFTSIIMESSVLPFPERLSFPLDASPLVFFPVFELEKSYFLDLFFPNLLAQTKSPTPR